MMTTHGATAGGARPPLYRVWKGMRSRCLDPNAQNYRWYGGRGITIAEVWEDFANFRVWAEEHGYAEGMELDRIDNDGLYSPENCRWVTKTTNLANRSGYLSEDVRTRLHELSEETGRSVPSLITEAVERFLTEEGR